MLFRSYKDGCQKCVTVNGISFQGITGGGIRVFYTQKHTLEAVGYVSEPPIPVVSFASQPKKYDQIQEENSKELETSVEESMEED